MPSLSCPSNEACWPRTRFFCLALLALFTASSFAAAQELPVRRVVIFKNGVAFVERAGPVSGGSSVDLSFRADEMTDVLKSLNLAVDGGAVQRVRFTTDESLEEKLKGFPFRIQPGQSLTPMLDALRGSVILAEVGGQPIEGTILSAQQVPATAQQPARDLVTLLQSDGSIGNFEVLALNRLRFQEARLQHQLTDYLRIVREARSTERRSVSIDLAEGGARRLVARYTTPMPVWKSSYRIVFPESGKPVLEGWALVDNTSGEDWQGVSLALVSGRPVSFLTNLYPPVNVSRPFVALPGISSLGPVTYEGEMQALKGVPGGVAGGVIGGIIAQSPRSAPPPPPAKAAAPMTAESLDAVAGLPGQDVRMRESAIAATAAGRDVGDLFSYDFPESVSVRKGESVMLPFLQKPVSAEKLLIFSHQNPVANHPMLAFEIDNDSELTLDGGPVTVFDGGSYAGEALFDTTVKGQKRLLSYGVDLGCTIRQEPRSGGYRVETASIRRGTLHISRRYRHTLEYSVSNADPRAKTLIVERPIRTGFDVVSPAPSSKTSTTNRYRVAVPANGTASLQILEENLGTESLALSNMHPSILATYITSKDLKPALIQELRRIADKRREIDDNQAELDAAKARLESINASMERIRRNLSSLNSVRGQETQVQRLAGDLNQQQANAVTVEESIETLSERGRELQRELNTLIDSIDITV
jgi:hypothetical protein